MKKLLIIFFSFAFYQIIFANDSIPGKKIIFNTKIITADGRKVQGYLTNIDDTAMCLTTQPLPFGNISAKQNISYNNISYVKVHRNGNVGRGIAFGLLAGVTTGVIIGLASGDDPPEQWFAMTAGQKAAGLGVVFGLTGAITGAIIGALTKQLFTINKNKENFHKMRTTILDKVYGENRTY